MSCAGVNLDRESTANMQQHSEGSALRTGVYVDLRGLPAERVCFTTQF